MPVRVSEVAAVLALLLLLLIAKHLPVFAGLPLGSVMGITAFAFAIYLSLKLFAFELARIRAEE